MAGIVRRNYSDSVMNITRSGALVFLFPLLRRGSDCFAEGHRC